MAETKNATRIDAAHITDNDTGERYELDFNRDAIRFAEGRGFEIENVTRYPVTGISDLFFYSFRMHHKSVSRAQTDKLIEKNGGLSEKLIARLIELYQQAMTSNIIRLDDEDDGKNAAMTVEL